MKVCHVTSVHSRYDIRIFEKECISLASAGYEVFLVVNDGNSDELKSGVHIVSTGSTSKSRLKRIIFSTNKVLKKAIEIDADIYQLHDPELLKIVTKLRKKGKKVIFDAHEDTEEQIRDKFWIPVWLRSIISKVYSKYAYTILSKLSGVITVTPKLVNKMRQYNENVAMVTNYPILKDNQSLDPSHNGFGHFLFFAGNVSEQWCQEVIAEAVGKVDDVEFWFAGRLDSDDYLKSIISHNRTKYLGIVSHSEVMEYYSKCLAGVAILKCAQVGKEGTLGNTKLFEVMQAGKPVICSELLLWKEIIDEYKCGICVNPDNVDEIVSAINYIKNNPEIASQMGENGRKAVKEKYNWSTQATELIEFYKKVGSR